MITMRKTIDNNVMHISLIGRLDSVTTPEIEDDLEGLSSFDEVVINMKELEYMSSAGLRFLLKVKKQNDHVIIEDVQEVVYEVLKVTGFADILTVR